MSGILKVAVVLGWAGAACSQTAPGPGDAIPWTVAEDAGVARSNAWVCNGLPVARELDWREPGELAVRLTNGACVPAQFEVLSRWAGGVTSTQPIQWLLVTFPASLAPGETLGGRIERGSNGAFSGLVSVSTSNNSLFVNTGAALFGIPTNRFGVFSHVAVSDGAGAWRPPLVNDAAPAQLLVAGSGVCTAEPPEEVTLEHQGPLRVTVRTAGHFAPAPGSAGRFRYILRYHFFAGNPGVDLDFYYDCPTAVDGGTGYEGYETNAYFLVQRLALVQPLALLGVPQAHLAAEPGQARDLAAANLPAALTQHLRLALRAPDRYTISAQGFATNGTRATRPVAAVRGANGGLAASLSKMWRHEPQALQITTNALIIEIIATNQWLGPRQGAAAMARLVALAPAADFSAAAAGMVAQLDHPIVAWPDRACVAESRALGELWDGSDDGVAQACLGLATGITANTLYYLPDHGMHGFMTWGLAPRLYANPIFADEVGDTNTWDGYYLGATFTDYHNMFYNAARGFALTGDRRALHELCIPAARRALSTLIVQGETLGEDRTGWGPIGYGGYRRDNNGSHSYFRNLFFYYWLTGDRHVPELLAQGAAFRRLQYTRRPDMTLIPPEEVPSDYWLAQTPGRMISQAAEINWFLGHAWDETYLADFSNQMARIASCHMALLTNSAGEECCFMFENPMRTNPGMSEVQQPWMSALYPLDNLWRLYSEFGDLALGPENVRISRIFQGFERFVWTIIARIPPGSSGTATSPMANSCNIFWSGPRVGGAYVTNDWTYVDPDSLLYIGGKSALTAPLFRAAYLRNMEAGMLQRAQSLEAYALANANEGSACWDKVTGEFYQNILPATAYYSPRISGTVAYGGSRTGACIVVAVTEPGSWNTNRACRLPAPGAYAFDHLPFVSNYWVAAFLDTNGSGEYEPGEPQGRYPGASLALTGNLAGIDITLSDLPPIRLDLAPGNSPETVIVQWTALSNGVFQLRRGPSAGNLPQSAATVRSYTGIEGLTCCYTDDVGSVTSAFYFILQQ